MKYLYIFIALFSLTLQNTFAGGGVLWNFRGSGSATDSAIKTWDIHTDDIPKIIIWAIDFFLWIAWSIAVVFIIFWAYKILFGSLEQDITKWRDTVFMALWGFAIASLAWFIVKFLLNNLS